MTSASSNDARNASLFASLDMDLFSQSNYNPEVILRATLSSASVAASSPSLSNVSMVGDTPSARRNVGRLSMDSPQTHFAADQGLQLLSDLEDYLKKLRQKTHQKLNALMLSNLLNFLTVGNLYCRLEGQFMILENQVRYLFLNCLHYDIIFATLMLDIVQRAFSEKPIWFVYGNEKTS
jgi:hypothetical protein